MSTFFVELKRRNVYRAAVFYAASAWLLVQVATQVFPFFHIAEWVVRWIVVAAVIGFPFALLFSWFYEWTPQGIVRESEVAPEASVTRQTGKKLDRWIIAILSLAVVLLLADKLVLHRAAGGDAAAPAASKSIAVLPFVNMSGDPNNEYFSDGITEEILNALAQISDLKVAARTSAFAFKGKDPDLRKVGEVLDVANVLEGSVQRSGDEVRITAQLIDTRSGYHLWSEKYDRKLTNIFAVEDEISRAIADRLQLQLAGVHADSAGNTGNPRAHEQYLRGLTLLAARGPGLRDAIDAFSQAVKLDPQYAHAWGALAEAEEALPGYVPEDRDAAMVRSESAAQRALGIDPDAPSALVALANVRYYRLEWAQADSLYRRALALAPGDAEAADQYAQFLFAAGQFEPALDQIDRAKRLDPFSAIIGTVRAGILMGLHRDADAAAELESVLAAHPDFYPACMTGALLYSAQKRYADAEVQLRAVARHLGVDADAKAVLARGIGDAGFRSAALASLNGAPANADVRADSILYSAFLALLGDRDHALDQLERFAARRDSAAYGLLWTSAFDSLRGAPRYAAVLKKMGLPYKPDASGSP